MTDQELQRRARGRARKARLERTRNRVLAFAFLALATFGVMANTAVDFMDEKVRVIENRRVVEYVPPQLPLVVSQVRDSKTSQPHLPDLLDLDELFPDYRDKHATEPKPIEPKPAQEPERQVAMLDDLGAAPPKNVYLEAVFRGGHEVVERTKPVRLSEDYVNASFGVPLAGGRTLPPIPEPSTGLLLGLGLLGLGMRPGARDRRARGRWVARATLPG